jgi:uncharacterized protein YbjT (DUF2867 family)
MIDWGGVNSSRRFTLSHLERDIAAVANDLRADLDQLLFEAPVKARNLLPAAVEIRAGDVTDPGSLRAARLGGCRAIFFAVDVTGGVGGRGFFKPASQIRAVTYEGLVNVVDAAEAAAFTGRFVLVSGMGSELPSFTGRLLNAIKGDLQGNQRDRDAYLRNSGLDWSIGRGGILTDEPGGRADIRVTPPVHRLSLLRRVARADFARALIAAADAPAVSARTFDVFNEPGAPPTDTELAERLEQLSKSS